MQSALLAQIMQPSTCCSNCAPARVYAYCFSLPTLEFDILAEQPRQLRTLLEGLARAPLWKLVPVDEPHKAYLPGPDVEQPVARAPVPIVERQGEFGANYRIRNNLLQSGDGLPRRSLLKMYKGHMYADRLLYCQKCTT